MKLALGSKRIMGMPKLAKSAWGSDSIGSRLAQMTNIKINVTKDVRALKRIIFLIFLAYP